MARLRFVMFLLGFITTCWAGEPSQVAFRLRNNFLVVVNGSIGPMQDLGFLVDTGATQSVVDREIAEKLGVVLGYSVVFVVGEKHLTPFVEINDLKLGPISVPKLSVLSMDLASLSRMAGVPIHAIVGLDVLRLQSFVIDYRHKLLQFGRVESLARSISFEPDTSSLVVKTLVNGAPLRLMIDSGAHRVSLFHDRLPVSLKSRTFLPASRQTVSKKFGAAYFVRDVNLEVGKVRLSNSVVFILPGETGSIDFDGHLGPETLGAKRVFFDFENRKLFWDN